MVGTNVKGETVTLMDKRASIEAEMNAIIERLNQPGGPGLSASLVDSQVSLLFHSYQYHYYYYARVCVKLIRFFGLGISSLGH